MLLTMKLLSTFLGTVGLVAAHGYVDNATIGGQFYQVSTYLTYQAFNVWPQLGHGSLKDHLD